VTWTTPTLPGVHVVKAASQWPAQATPLDARFRIEVSLEEKVMGTLRLVPEAVVTAEVKLIVLPNTIDVLVVGFSVTWPAKRGGPALVPPPQAAKAHRAKIVTAKRRLPEGNLPMHPSKHFAVAGVEQTRA
jgi:hypothetical protein